MNVLNSLKLNLIQDLSIVNQDIKQFDIVLCKFYFSDISKSKNRPPYATLTEEAYQKYHKQFCNYVGC